MIAFRRWPQLVSPDVWVEDGTLIIPSFAQYGWAGLFVPVAGYLVVPAKLISFISLTLTFEHYALVSTILAIAAQSAVVAAIAIAPTTLAAPLLAAAIVPVLPIGSEVYALPSYTFWWTTLLVFIGLFWRCGERPWWRAAAIIAGGLSSPFIIVAWPIFGLRAAVERTRDNLVAVALSVSVAAVQAGFLLREHASNVSPLDALHALPELISKYFGTALYSEGQHGAGLFGVAVLAFLVAGIAFVPRGRRLVYLMLGLCLAAAIVTSIVRVSVSAPHPILAGPRYFFFPVILTAWMLLMIAQEAQRPTGMVAMLIMGAYVPSAAAGILFEPQVAKQPWVEQAAACTEAPGPYTFDIQYGIPEVSWSSTMQGDDCRRIKKAAIFD